VHIIAAISTMPSTRWLKLRTPLFTRFLASPFVVTAGVSSSARIAQHSARLAAQSGLGYRTQVQVLNTCIIANGVAPNGVIARTAAADVAAAISAPSAAAIAPKAVALKAATAPAAHIAAWHAASSTSPAAPLDGAASGALLGDKAWPDRLLLVLHPTSGDATGTAEVSEGASNSAGSLQSALHCVLHVA